MFYNVAIKIALALTCGKAIMGGESLLDTHGVTLLW
jgi:hypothetical protein